MKKRVIDLVEELLTPFLEEHELELYDVEFSKEGGERVLRVYVDHENGVSTDHCKLVSDFLNSELDKEDPITDAYLLEVSSPGIERVLTREWHYERAIGKTVKASLYKAFEGSKTIEGELSGVTGEELIIKVENKELNVPRNLISKIRLVFNFS